VGGGIIAEGLPWGAAGVHAVRAGLGPLAALAPLLVHGVAGLAVGALALAATTLGRRAWAGFRALSRRG